MLEVHELAVNYRGVCALHPVSFKLAPGQLVGLIGPNGAGKSTMVKAILGLIPAAKGWASFRTRPLQQQLRRVAYVPQRSQIDWDYPIKVQNVVKMARTAHTGWFRQSDPRSHALVQSALERVGMWDLRQRQLGELSGGQQQRVFLARALAQQAELLFFDEPFTGVDRKAEEILLDVFAQMKAQNKTLLVISHGLEESLRDFDRLLLLNKRLIAEGGRQEVLTAANICEAYGHDLRWMVT